MKKLSLAFFWDNRLSFSLLGGTDYYESVFVTMLDAVFLIFKNFIKSVLCFHRTAWF